MEKFKSLLVKYGVSVSVGAAMSAFVLFAYDFSSLTLPVDKYRVLTDAFSIPGIILVMVGCLVWVSTEGFFDMISYGLRWLGQSLIPFSEKNHESFYDYKMRKSENRLTGYSFLFYTGFAFLVIAIVFLILFYSVFE